MKYFIDTEFIEYPGTIDLISIGIKCEDQREFYAENADADLSKADDFVQEHVIPQLIMRGGINHHEALGNGYRVYDGTKAIAKSVLNFIGNDIPEFWGYFADYDWVLFCWLFGRMIDLPKGWPMYCRDLKQLADSLDKPRFDGPKGEHNALADARWNMEFYNYLMEDSNG